MRCVFYQSWSVCDQRQEPIVSPWATSWFVLINTRVWAIILVKSDKQTTSTGCAFEDIKNHTNPWEVGFGYHGNNHFYLDRFFSLIRIEGVQNLLSVQFQITRFSRSMHNGRQRLVAFILGIAPFKAANYTLNSSICYEEYLKVQCCGQCVPTLDVLLRNIENWSVCTYKMYGHVRNQYLGQACITLTTCWAFHSQNYTIFCLANAACRASSIFS